MPKRTAKITRSDDKTVREEEGVEHTTDEPQNENEKSMLSLDDLKQLVFLGRLKETVEIAGFKFVVTTLSVKQQKEIMERVMLHEQSTRLLDIKPLTVSYVIESINGVPLSELCEDEGDIVDQRMNIIMGMQTVVVERLYQVYESLVAESNKEVGLENLNS